MPPSRFDRTETRLHWTNAALVFVLLATGSSLYFGPLSEIVRRRELVKTIHVYAGLALPVPILVAFAGPWRRALVHDVRRLDDPRDPKFNQGQKANASFIAAALVLMFATGLMLRWPGRFADDIRTGATFVHDWTFVGLFVSITGHVVMAVRQWRRDRLLELHESYAQLLRSPEDLVVPRDVVAGEQGVGGLVQPEQ